MGASNTSNVVSRLKASFLTLILIGSFALLVSLIGFSSYGASTCSKKNATRATLATIKNALNQYQAEQSVYPPVLETLVEVKILEPGKMKDGWRRPLIYRPLARSPEQPFILFSLGLDGKPLTQDDVDAFGNETHKVD